MHSAKQKAMAKVSTRKESNVKAKARLSAARLSIEQRRAKLRDLKAKSKCLRCGGMGHWAGDPGCKFANKPQPPKPTANLAYESESSDDEKGFVYAGAATSTEQTNAAMMAFRSGASGKGSRPRPSQAQSSMAHANDATSSVVGRAPHGIRQCVSDWTVQGKDLLGCSASTTPILCMGKEGRFSRSRNPAVCAMG